MRQTESMALGFGIGSMLFGAGSVLALCDVAPLIANVVYAIGAVFFTTAAAVQWQQAADYRPVQPWKDADWLASVIQFVGTLCFNVMTIRGVILAADPSRLPYGRVWTPDVVGSAMFLISSWIAWRPQVRRHRHEVMGDRSRLICLANLIGSIFFAVSAWGAMLRPSGDLTSVYWASMGTLLGAIGFLVASIALFPRKGERAEATPSA